jgi:hypothetical protein
MKTWKPHEISSYSPSICLLVNILSLVTPLAEGRIRFYIKNLFHLHSNMMINKLIDCFSFNRVSGLVASQDSENILGAILITPVPLKGLTPAHDQYFFPAIVGALTAVFILSYPPIFTYFLPCYLC